MCHSYLLFEMLIDILASVCAIDIFNQESVCTLFEFLLLSILIGISYLILFLDVHARYVSDPLYYQLYIFLSSHF